MLDEHERKYSLDLAKEALCYYLLNDTHLTINAIYIVEQFGKHSDLLAKQGCFVTLKKNQELRGCIGTIVSNDSLYKNIINNAIAAGSKDPRFPKVKSEELSDISFEISVMGPVKLVKNITDINIGEHGLIIKKGLLQGLLLPQVAVEHEWDVHQFLKQTCLKAGLDPSALDDEDTELFYFSSEVFS